MNKEALCVFAGFAYLTNVIDENNGEIPHRLKVLYSQATKITLMYEHTLDESVSTINEIVKEYPKKSIDLLLTSVTVFSEYMEQMRGKKRTFTPMKYEHIKEIQDEIEEELHNNGDKEKVYDTYDFCHWLVKKILLQQK